MPIQRQTAMKVRVVDIVSGEFVKMEGMEPSYVVTPAKENVSRARIVGTVVNKFSSEDGNFSSVTIDDSTATMRAKVWKEIEVLNDTQAGDLVSLIGKVREYEGEIYIVPEIIRKVTPDEESMFRLEILEQMKNRGATPAPKAAPVQKPAPAQPVQAAPKAQEAPQTAPVDQSPAPQEKMEAVDLPEKEDAQPSPQQTLQPASAEQPKPELAPAAAQPQQGEENMRMKVLTAIEQNPDGIKYSDLMQQLGAPEEDLEDVINELLGEGVCYEPIPGKIKKI